MSQVIMNHKYPQCTLKEIIAFIHGTYQSAHRGRVTHIWVGKLTSLVQIMNGRSTARSHYQNQCCNIVSCTLRNKRQWNFNQNSNIIIAKMYFKMLYVTVVHFVSTSMCWYICSNNDLIKASLLNVYSGYVLWKCKSNALFKGIENAALNVCPIK